MKKFHSMTKTALCLLTMLAATQAYGQYPKMILIEDFSSVTCTNCPQAAEIVKKIANEHLDRVRTTQWHLDIPGRNDPFYAANKPQNTARAAYYGSFNALPQVFVNGVASVGTNEATVRSDVNGQLSEEAPIGISVTHQRDGANVNVKVTIQTQEGLGSGYRLYAVAVEGLVHKPEQYFIDFKSQPYLGETEFRDLFRTFLTPTDGVEVTLAANGTKNYDYSYSIGEDWNADDMYVIAWVQDEFSNDILQAGSSPLPPSLSVKEEHAISGYSFGNVAPNPASTTAHVDFTLGKAERATLTLHTTQGELVREIPLGMMEEGSHRAEIDLNDLTSGLYTLTLQAGEYRASQKLTVVR